MQSFIHSLVAHNLQNRKYILVENGSWAVTCGGQMRAELEKLKGSEFLGDLLCLKSTLKKEQLVDLDNVVITIEKSLEL
jgi:flavorubredoxin